VPFPAKSSELLFRRLQTVPENYHRVGGGRNRSEPIARLGNCGACGHYVAYLLHGPLGRLMCCRLDHVVARISKCRRAKCEREHRTCTSNRPAGQATEPASCFHALIVIPVASLFGAILGQKNDPFSHPKSIRPKKMFQAQMVEMRLRFFAPAAPGSGQFFVNSSSRFPL